MKTVDFEVRLLEKTKALETVSCTRLLSVSNVQKMLLESRMRMFGK